MSDEVLLNLATQMEGHPDNVAAALFGGATVAWTGSSHEKEVAHSIQVPVDPRIRAMAFIPSNSLATKKARTLLPESIPFADAQRNSTHTALLMHALTIRPDLLFTATEDFLHQSYRSEAMPASFALMTKLRAAGVAAFISGAGPTVMALHTGNQEESEQLGRAGGAKFEGKSLEIASRGASLL
jgi:homoserine kinase